MKIVIFAGGIGKRLWPLSRKDTPKQFQKIFNEETSLEHAYKPLVEAFGIENVYISTGEDFVEHTQKALPELKKENIIVEPLSRDNGPAVAFSMNKIAQSFPNEPVVIRWQNSLIKDNNSFISALLEAENILENKEASLIYLGVPSRYPNTNLGHIKLGEKIRDLKNAIALHKFDSFVEKPSIEKATQYHESRSFLWNPGCYVTTPNFILNNLRSTSPEIMQFIDQINENASDEYIKEIYTKMPKISIDYALWEKLSPEGVMVVEAEYGWNYISTWSDVKKALSNFEGDNVSLGQTKVFESSDTLSYNYCNDKLLCTVGLKGINVISTDDAILVISDEYSAKLKDLLGSLEGDLSEFL